MKRIPEKQKRGKTKSPFITFTVTSVICILIASIGFTFLIFGNDSVYKVTNQNSVTGKVDLPISYEKVVSEIEQEQGLPALSGVGSTGDPDLMPGLTNIHVDASMMYQNMSIASSTSNTSQNGIPMYNGWPSSWGSGDVTFINWPGLINKWYEDVARIVGVTKESIRKQGFSPASDSYCAAVLQNIDGVDSLPMCYYPAMCIPNYYERSFSGEVIPWSASIASSYYACLVVENVTTGNAAYIPITQSDNKGHTYPGGILQTFAKNTSSTEVQIANTVKLNGNKLDKDSIPGFTYVSGSYGSGDGAVFKVDTRVLLQLYATSSNPNNPYPELYYGNGLTKPHGSIETNGAFTSKVQALLNDWNIVGIAVKQK